MLRIGLLCVLVALSVSAEEALVRGCRLELEQAAVAIAPQVFYPGWVSRTPDGGWKPDDAGRRSWTFRDKASAEVAFEGTGQYEVRADGVLKVTYGWKRRLAAPVIYAAVGMRLPCARYGGGTVLVNGKPITLPIQKSPKVMLWSGSLTNLVCRDAQGRETFALSFPFPRPCGLQDNREWKTDEFGLRIQVPEAKTLGKGDRTHIDFEIRAPERIACSAKPVVLTAGDDWIPLLSDWHIVPGSALDFSGLRGGVGPAGRYGYPCVRNGHFEFEKLPNVPQRFYGCNIVAAANYPDEDVAEDFAANLARVGYNAVRFHHHDHGLSAGPHGQLNEVNMRRFDRLVAACIANGLYMTTDLYVSRKPLYRDLGLNRKGRCTEIGHYKILVHFCAGAYQDLLDFSRAFLAHVNPFTGRRYADEPALGWISLVNEGNLRACPQLAELPEAQMAWKAWLAAKKATDATFASVSEQMPTTARASQGKAPDATQTAFLLFLAEREALFAQKMTHFLREEMKCRALITDMNLPFAPVPYEVVRHAAYDYVDDHFYVDHPHFLETKWRLPSRCPNSNPFLSRDRGARRAAGSRIYGKPFVLTEYNYSGPGRFRGVGGIATAALAALQDWDGLWRFAWSHGERGVKEAKPMTYFDMSGDPLSLASERASVLLFLRRDVAPLKPAGAFLLPPEQVAACRAAMPFVADGTNGWVASGWHTRLGTTVGALPPAGVTTLGTFPHVYGNAQWSAAQNPLQYPCGGGAVVADGEKGVFTLATPFTAGGFAEKGLIVAGAFSARLADAAATVWASSLDSHPLDQSDHLLVTHLTDVQNTGITYADKTLQVLLKWGDLPHLMRRGQAEITLKVGSGAWKVHALDTTGRRRGEVPCAIAKGRLTFMADVARDAANATFLYELVRSHP